MLGALAGTGDVEFVSQREDADVLIVNTCGFINSAKEESINAILDAVRLKQTGRVTKVIVTGCLAQRYGNDLAKEIPEVDAYLGIESGPRVGNVVFGARPAKTNLVTAVEEKYPLVPPARLRASATPWTAYLKVSEGCDHTCTFCAIPGIRGKHRSKPIERLVQEATDLAASGVFELNLVAQDTTAYGMDLYGRLALPELLDRLSAVPGILWIRLLYCYPTMVRQPLIDAINAHPNVIPYIDMPLQHGNDAMLKRMKRGGNVDQYRRLFDKMRDSIPDLTLRTTFLVGFPGETEEEFADLLKFVTDVKFDRVGVFTYSAEEGTPSFDMPGAVPARVMRSRRDQVMAAQQPISLENNRRWIGRELDVVIEGVRDGIPYGRSFRDAPEIDGAVILSDSSALNAGELPDARPTTHGAPARLPGTLVRAQITAAQAYDLNATVL